MTRLGRCIFSAKIRSCLTQTQSTFATVSSRLTSLFCRKFSLQRQQSTRMFYCLAFRLQKRAVLLQIPNDACKWLIRQLNLLEPRVLIGGSRPRLRNESLQKAEGK